MGAQTGKPILSLLLREQMKLPLLFDAPGFVPPAIGGGLRRAWEGCWDPSWAESERRGGFPSDLCAVRRRLLRSRAAPDPSCLGECPSACPETSHPGDACCV